MAVGKKFIQKADLKKGALRRQLGTPAGQDIPEKQITSKISALRKQAEGEKKLPAAKSRLLKRLILARTFKKPGFRAKKRTLMAATAT